MPFDLLLQLHLHLNTEIASFQTHIILILNAQDTAVQLQRTHGGMVAHTLALQQYFSSSGASARGGP